MSNCLTLQPVTYRAFQRGVDQLVGAIRPTLGPLPRLVAVAGTSRLRPPELLDDGALIARRIIELPERSTNMGAMYLRHVLWRLHERYGDGTATGAVLFQSVYDQAVRYVVAGGDAMALRGHLEAAAGDVFRALDGMVIRREGEAHLTQVAATICADPELAAMLGEIFDIVGPYGFVDIRSGRGRALEREYTEGLYWRGGVFSAHMLPDPLTRRVELEDVAILVTDFNFTQADDLLPALRAAAAAGHRRMVIVASGLTDSALGLLIANQNPDRFHCIGVRLPSEHPMGQDAALEDLSTLTGGRPFRQAAGDTLASIRPDDLGRARRVWATPEQTGLIGGRGDPRRLRQHIAYLRDQHAWMTESDARRGAQERIGKLIGGSATLWVGGSSPVGIEARKGLAQRTADAMRGVLTGGVVPGGGTALLACRPALQACLSACADLDEKAAYRIVLRAVEEPFRAIVSNAGYEPGAMLAGLRRPADGVDVRTGAVVDMCEAGIYDAAAVTKAVAYTAIASAALALTVDVLVHGRQPELTLQP
jgi:chaperonin GroEL